MPLLWHHGKDSGTVNLKIYLETTHARAYRLLQHSQLYTLASAVTLNQTPMMLCMQLVVKYSIKVEQLYLPHLATELDTSDPIYSLRDPAGS